MRSPTMWAAQSRAKLSMCTWNAWSSAAFGVHAGAMCTLYAAALEPKQTPDHKTKRNRHVRGAANMQERPAQTENGTPGALPFCAHRAFRFIGNV